MFPRVSSQDRLIVVVVPISAYLSHVKDCWCVAASHPALLISLKLWHCCLHFFPLRSPNVDTHVRLGGYLHVLCRNKGETRESTCTLFCGSQWPCRSSLVDEWGKIWGTEGREKEADIFFSFYGTISSSLSFSSDSLHSPTFMQAAAKGRPGWPQLPLCDPTWANTPGPSAALLASGLVSYFRGKKRVNAEQTRSVKIVSLSATFCAVVPPFSAPS